MALVSGTRLGPYVITSPLGAGGMGEVYKATDTRLDRIVAVKILSEHIADDAELRARFEREARLPLFKTGLTTVDPYRLNYVPSADGKRILVNTPINEADRPAITVVMNWTALLKR